MTAVMGWDVSLHKTGLCLPSGQTVTIQTDPRQDRGQRLHTLRTFARYYLRTVGADLAVIEAVPPMIRQVDTAVALGMAQGVVREILAEYRIPAGDIVNTTLKLFACGRGDADKPDMVAAANRHRMAGPLEGAPPITDDNEADAWWLRAMGLWWKGHRIVGGSADSFLHADDVRTRCVFGPWNKTPGAKWPGKPVAVTRRRQRATPPGHPSAKPS